MVIGVVSPDRSFVCSASRLHIGRYADRLQPAGYLEAGSHPRALGRRRLEGLGALSGRQAVRR